MIGLLSSWLRAFSLLCVAAVALGSDFPTSCNPWADWLLGASSYLSSFGLYLTAICFLGEEWRLCQSAPQKKKKTVPMEWLDVWDGRLHSLGSASISIPCVTMSLARPWTLPKFCQDSLPREPTSRVSCPVVFLPNLSWHLHATQVYYMGPNDSKCLCPPSDKFCRQVLNLPEEHTALPVVFVWYFCQTAGGWRW